MGSVADTLAKLAPRGLPDKDEVIRARNNDLAYGTPFAGYSGVNSRLGSVDAGDVPDIFRGMRKVDPSKYQKPMDTETSDGLYAAWMAAQRSPVAALGFDPSRMITSPQNGVQLNVDGLYKPSSDAVWYDQSDPSSAVHEATHRGFKIMKDEGSKDVPGGDLPFNWTEEPNVRALMLRNYGSIERGRGAAGDKEVDIGQRLLERVPDHFPRMERAASELLRKRDHKMGPR